MNRVRGQRELNLDPPLEAVTKRPGERPMENDVRRSEDPAAFAVKTTDPKRTPAVGRGPEQFALGVVHDDRHRPFELVQTTSQPKPRLADLLDEPQQRFA